MPRKGTSRFWRPEKTYETVAKIGVGHGIATGTEQKSTSERSLFPVPSTLAKATFSFGHLSTSLIVGRVLVRKEPRLDWWSGALNPILICQMGLMSFFLVETQNEFPSPNRDSPCSVVWLRVNFKRSQPKMRQPDDKKPHAKSRGWASFGYGTLGAHPADHVQLVL